MCGHITVWDMLLQTLVQEREAPVLWRICVVSYLLPGKKRREVPRRWAF